MATFRISDAAGVLGVSADTVRRWVDNGRLPAVGMVAVAVIKSTNVVVEISDSPRAVSH